MDVMRCIQCVSFCAAVMISPRRMATDGRAGLLGVSTQSVTMSSQNVLRCLYSLSLDVEIPLTPCQDPILPSSLTSTGQLENHVLICGYLDFYP